MQRLLPIVSTALITAGAVVLVDVGVTLAWKEPLSTIYGSIQQGAAEDSLDELTEEFPTAADLRALASTRNVEKRVARLADAFERELEPGRGIGRIEIPAIDLDAVLIEGTDTTSLRKGPGRYPELALPGQGETVGVAGHRTTYLAPFHDIDELEPGDEIVLEMPYATATYEVESHEIVDPLDVGVVGDVGYERVVLTACHPLYSAAERYVVSAKLVEVALAPAAVGRR